MINKVEFFTCSDPRFKDVEHIRRLVFVGEQGIDENEEFDDFDKTCEFALLYSDGVPSATARLVSNGEKYKIGRIAVLKQFRSCGLGAQIARAVTEKAFDCGADYVLVDAQNYAVPFYEKLGFSVIGGQIVDRGIYHTPMRVQKTAFYERM